MDELVTYDRCGKSKPKSEVTLMQEGVGIRFSKNSRAIEERVLEWVEEYSNKKISLFPHLCSECQHNEYFRQIISGRI